MDDVLHTQPANVEMPVAKAQIGGRAIVKLPFGYLDNGIMRDEVEIREMTGNEEELIADAKIPLIERISRVIGNCVEKIVDITDKNIIQKAVKQMSTEDRTCLVVNLRILSLGPLYDFIATCTSCSKSVKATVDLSTLEVTPAYSKETLFQDIVLPSGKKCKIKVQQGVDEETLDKFTSKNKNKILTAAIYLRVAELDDKKPTMEEITNLSWADRTFLRNQFDKLEGGLDMEISITCAGCDTDFTSNINIGQAEFFFPKG